MRLSLCGLDVNVSIDQPLSIKRGIEEEEAGRAFWGPPEVS